MRASTKSRSIYNDLREDIASGRLQPGQRLPKESEFCTRFGVARETLRRALGRLEAENLIERRRSLGTFVKAAETGEGVITFLLPCPNFLSRRGGMPQFNRLIFEGVLTECFRRNCRVSTLAVSSDNDNTRIDARQLEHLGPASRVVVQSPWFAPLFPTLEKLGCRVVFISGGLFDPATERIPHAQPPANAKKIIFNLRYAFELATARLRGRGRRRIALAAPYIDDPDSSIRGGYLDVLARDPEAAPRLRALSDSQPRWPWLRDELAMWHARERFDGLVLCPGSADEPPSGLFTHETLGLPPEVDVTLAWLLPKRTLDESPLPSVVFDAPALGAAAAAALLEPVFVGNETLIAPQYIQPPARVAPEAALAAY